MLNAMNSVEKGEITADTNLSYIKRNVDKVMTDQVKKIRSSQ